MNCSKNHPAQSRTNLGQTGRKKLTPVMILHYVKLVVRSLLFLALLTAYVLYHLRKRTAGGTGFDEGQPVVLCFCILHAIGILLRFFPSKLESPGCQKQFARNYIKSGEVKISIQDNHATVLVLLVWVLFNMIFGMLYLLGLFDDGILILLCGIYSICDMICILFFCPFQSWFLKNKCCNVCRIYNWDYAMIFTPLFFTERVRLKIMLLLAMTLALRWEITFFRHPERFSEKTNSYLHCENCTEKLCSHKKQLLVLWKQIEQYTMERIRRLRK